MMFHHKSKRELEASDPLPPTTHAEYDRVYVDVSDVEDLLKRRAGEMETARKQAETARNEAGELVEAYGSFVGRWDRDLILAPRAGAKKAKIRSSFGDDNNPRGSLTSLVSLLGRTTFADFDGGDVTELFDSATEEMRWLTDERPDVRRDALLRNADGVLLRLLRSSEEEEEGSAKNNSTY